MDIYKYFERIINDAIAYEKARGQMPKEYDITSTEYGWECRDTETGDLVEIMLSSYAAIEEA